MANVAQRVEGFEITTNYLGKKGSIGSLGTERSMPAFSMEAAMAYIESVRQLNVTYAYQLIRGAQFVILPSGEVVDNGKPTVGMHS